MPALVVLPMLGGQGSAALDWKAIVLPLVAAATVVVAGRYALRPLLRVVAGTRAQEAFTAAALLVVVGTALLFDSVGLSMALGAFIAGVLLADSEYRHELEADIEPFKGLLLGLFFMAVGMSANLGVLIRVALHGAGADAWLPHGQDAGRRGRGADRAAGRRDRVAARRRAGGRRRIRVRAAVPGGGPTGSCLARPPSCS